ncbi:MAG: cysteine desulfurase family protein [Acidobacteriota bacterium]|nr:cysteine desulfurase family protein [Acidobacteriota bacterium]
MIYLDNNGTTPVHPEVLKAMLPYFTEKFGNPSSIHVCGRRTLAAVKEARTSVAKLLGCQPTEILFTSGGTEGDNMALAGMVHAGDHIITSVIEHGAVLEMCRYLEHTGCEVTRVGVNGKGQVEPESVRQAIKTNTRLISIMAANNETGVLQPVEEIGKIATDADIWFHTDAVQAVGKTPIDVDRIGCDLLTITAHKFNGPQGIGALYVRRGTPLRPLLHGGHQQGGKRPGTENIAGIAGLGRACELAFEGLQDGSMKRIEEWRNKLEEAVLAQIPDCGVHARTAPRVANTSNIYFDHVGGDALVLALDEQDIAASRGAACNSGEAEPSSVLMAMGVGGERSRSSIRFSLGKMNVESDIDLLITVLPKAVETLRARTSFSSETQGVVVHK